jgi:rhodanese-related sulfurtransferase
MKYILPFLLAALSTASIAQSQSGATSGVPTAAIPKTTEVLVIQTAKQGVNPQQIMAVMPEEIRATVKLYFDGKIRQWYSRGDGKGVVFLVDVKTEDEARAIMETLPLAKEQLMDHQYIPVGPLMPLRALMTGPGAQTGQATGAKQIAPEDLRNLIDKNTKTLIIDVRDSDEFEKETIKGAINVPLAQLEPKLRDVPKDTTLVFTCNTGLRSAQAAKLAEQAGFKTAQFCPLVEWKEKGNPTEAGTKLFSQSGDLASGKKQP